ncbi:cysteine hydrolase family protein [Lentilactobacillus kefiri]|jgi:nicotinamidase-related amidase|uniref:Isochorismatase hydrolase n=2 Tax=Lentilactobacillus kefiri TaxID=33962 RepID=A0A8E1V296_LENKE|nr:isochorismatase family cysteine hydrolase [Lentilactobacillus kefiri]KRM52860.1 isochorismatase hydrolase [Lentilactobacillus kefiri DSM 20587 = JCM 5818]MCJ2161958.1 cysteine hydrolase [Lentilactobacillus kefiri]MCP9369060.1 cysteine hydrolase [Lentilactobacillus kefiri]MDH5109559.1 cysteine hydrolase [Lentilactobacillus kefiri]MDM7493823.1 isochorismatase family cysteine hydrolase [Lentilactobacillus kefiri]
MESHTALLIIDYTNDFVADKGALTCGKPGQKLEPSIIGLADKFVSNGDWVILPTDVHKPNDPYHPETKLFPPHNVRGTWGREFYGGLSDWYKSHQNDDKVYMYDKTRYSAFAGTDLDIRLRERHIDTVHLVGVCTDICVLHTAVDAYNLCYNIVVHKSGVAGLTQAGNDWALSHFEHVLGATVED